MSHRNRVQPTVRLEVDGEAYELEFDFDAIAAAEGLTGQPLLSGMNQKNALSPTINFVRAMLFACIQKHQPQMAYGDVKALINQHNFADIWVKVLKTWETGFPDPTPPKNEELASALPQ